MKKVVFLLSLFTSTSAFCATLCGSGALMGEAVANLNAQLYGKAISEKNVSLQLINPPGFTDLETVCLTFNESSKGYKVQVVCGENTDVESAVGELNQLTSGSYIYNIALAPAPTRQEYSRACSAISR